MTKAEKIEVLKGAKSEIYNNRHMGFCKVLWYCSDVTLNEFPEIINTNQAYFMILIFWFSRDEAGQKQRLEILDKVIAELEGK